MSEETKEYAYFLGCITPNRYPGIEVAAKKIFKEFGIESKEMEGASCCPAPGVFGSFDMYTWLPIAARNLAIAEEMGLEIYVTCNGCFGSLQEADHLLKAHPKLKEKVNEILGKVGREYKGTTNVYHAVTLLHDDIGLDRLKEKVTKPMKGVNVAIHYGCHFLKPSEVRGLGSSVTSEVGEHDRSGRGLCDSSLCVLSFAT
jgi:heterodisulfide reductase subunit B